MEISTNKNDGYVEWHNGDQTVRIAQSGIVYAYPHGRKAVMIISAFEGTNAYAKYYLHGDLILRYNENSRQMDTFKGPITFGDNIRSADYDESNRSYVLMLDENGHNSVVFLREDNLEIVNKLEVPSYFKAVSLKNIDGMISVVLRAMTDEECDKYGRSDWRFKINYSEGILVKDGITM